MERDARSRVSDTVWDVADLNQRLIDTWNDLSQSMWAVLLINGARDFSRPVRMKKQDILNTCCNIWVECRLVVWINWMFY